MEETRIAQHLSSLQDSRNHCVPVLDVFTDPFDPQLRLLVMPYLRQFNDPNFGTVGEVIDAVYQYMLIPVSQEEYSFFPHDIQRATSKAYWRRHDSAKQAGNVQLLAAVERGGMRRMDVLGIKTKFIALLPDSDRSSWTIVLAPSNS